MIMILAVSALALTGVAVDVCWVYAVRSSAAGRPVRTALASFVLAVVQLTLTVAVFSHPAARSVAGILAFALGSAVGSYATARRRS